MHQVDKKSSVGVMKKVLTDLQEAVGVENVTTDQVILATYAFDSSIQPPSIPGE